MNEKEQNVFLNKLKEMNIGFEAGSRDFTEKRPTLVMLHGAGGRSRIWKNQVQPLNDFMNTLALDLPGHGKTLGRGKSLVSEYSRWLKKILEKLFREQVFLMGHSLGGAIAQDLALLNPHLLKGLILVGTGAVLRVAPKFLEGFQNNFEETVDTVMGYAYAPGADQSLVREGAGLMKAAGADVVTNDFLACDMFDRHKDLEKIDLPCLIVCGEKDKLTPPALSEILEKSIRKSTLKILPSAGHHIMVEKHEAFNKCVKEFVIKIQNGYEGAGSN
jgi:pimeloyl-ACP methyl ester carboxylesterase